MSHSENPDGSPSVAPEVGSSDQYTQWGRFRSVLRKGWRRFTGPSNRKIKKLYEEHDYLEAYARHTDIRVHRDPHAAIGANWYEHGQHQLSFLVEHGLKPEHRLLDFGCGCLRAGRYFMRYLQPGHYTGVDISESVLEFGRELIRENGLEDHKPNLIHNADRSLDFSCCKGATFDRIQAYSVFTHLDHNHIAEFFSHLDSVLRPGGVFFFSYNDSDDSCQTGLKDFRHPFSFFEELAQKHGFEIQEMSKAFKDPGTQNFARVQRNTETPFPAL